MSRPRLLPGLAAVWLLAALPASADTLSGEAQGLFTLSDVASGLGPVTDFRFLPDGRLVITEKSGALKVRQADGRVVVAGTLSVDTESEKGLLGVEVDPAFASNRFLYLYWSRSGEVGGTDENRHRLSRFTLREDDTLALESEQVLVEGLRGPANHDGGALAIGPDGHLYVGVGDTGFNSGAPPGGEIGNFFATCLSNGNGKILRVRLDGSIPEDNPLVGRTAVTACGENPRTDVASTGTAAPRTDIWAWGFRNPWRFWFDPRTGNLWVGDVGEVTYEEISIARCGRHHGWPYREGAQGYPPSRCATLTPSTGECVDPLYYCRHEGAAGGLDGECDSITGGAIIDSCSWPEAWRGRYYFGDNANGRLWSLRLDAQRTGTVGPGARVEVGRIEGGSPVSIRPGPDGHLYVGVLGFAPGAGRIVRLAPASPAACTEPDAGSAPPAESLSACREGQGGAPGPDPAGPPPPAAPSGSGCGGCASAGGGAGLGLLLALARLARAGRRGHSTGLHTPGRQTR